MKQLARLLFLQGNRCFLCGEPIPLGEASVEHLLATSNGGTNGDDNCIVCCKAVNSALGNLSLKAKIQAVINHRDGFNCPSGFGVAQAASMERRYVIPLSDNAALVLADLQKRGSSKPRRVDTLKNTINSIFQMALTAHQLESLIAELTTFGYVSITATKVSYSLPAIS